MKVIILSAGKSTRMLSLTKNKPKALLKLPNNKTLLLSQLEVFSNFSTISEIIIVVGYFAEKIEKKLNNEYSIFRKYFDIKTIFNPFYDLADNLISLWLARYEMNDDVIVFNGDNYVTDIVVTKLLNDKSQICMVIDRKDHYSEDDMKVITEKKRVLKIGKHLNPNIANGESIGMVKFTSNTPNKLIEVLDKIVRSKKAFRFYWLEAIQRLINENNEVNYVEVPANSWVEIDIHDDYKYLQEFIRQKIKSTSKFSKISEGRMRKNAFL